MQPRGIHNYELVPIVQSAGTPPDTPAAATAQPTTVTVTTPAVLPVKLVKQSRFTISGATRRSKLHAGH